MTSVLPFSSLKRSKTFRHYINLPGYVTLYPDPGVTLLMNTMRMPFGSPVRRCVVITLPRAILLCFVNSEYFAYFSKQFLF